MRNLAMKFKLTMGLAIDLSENNINADGDIILTEFVDGMDYCHAKKEAWIWSIGKHKQHGYMLASYTTKFYQNENFQCLFLR